MGASAHDRGAGEGVEEGKPRERVTEKGRGRVEAEGQTRGRVKDEDQGRGRVEDEDQGRLRVKKEDHERASSSGKEEEEVYWGSPRRDPRHDDVSDDPRNDAEETSMGLASEAAQRTAADTASAHDRGAKSSMEGEINTWAAFVGRPDSNGNWTRPVCQVQKDREEKLQCHVWSKAGDSAGHPAEATQKTWFPDWQGARTRRRKRRNY